MSSNKMAAATHTLRSHLPGSVSLVEGSLGDLRRGWRWLGSLPTGHHPQCMLTPAAELTLVRCFPAWKEAMHALDAPSSWQPGLLPVLHWLWGPTLLPTCGREARCPPRRLRHRSILDLFLPSWLQEALAGEWWLEGGKEGVSPSPPQ